MFKHNILGISGSLRSGSSNTALLSAYQILAPRSIEFSLYQNLSTIPLFNPDLNARNIPAVVDFQNQLKKASAVIIASPEYSHGVTGVLKNALDWVTESGELSKKPVVLPNASARATIAHQALMEIIRTMDAKLVVEASLTIPLPTNQITKEEIVNLIEIKKMIEESWIELLKKI